LNISKVSDWGIQQCRSIKVQILEAPQLRVNPPSATLYRGESLTLRCLSQISDHRYGTLGYSWTKNDALFQSDPNLEMWEDLYPDGSILRIKNIQRSAVYSCVVSNSVTPVSKDVHVTVVERDSVTLCPPDRAYGVEWPASAAGPPVLADCPNLAEGQAQRVCEQKSAVKTEWLQPDFSNCASSRMVEIHNNVSLDAITIFRIILIVFFCFSLYLLHSFVS
jgi:Immunoglobulin domain